MPHQNGTISELCDTQIKIIPSLIEEHLVFTFYKYMAYVHIFVSTLQSQMDQMNQMVGPL